MVRVSVFGKDNNNGHNTIRVAAWTTAYLQRGDLAWWLARSQFLDLFGGQAIKALQQVVHLHQSR